MNPKAIALAVLFLAACGPTKRGTTDPGTVDAPGTTCQPSSEVCNDGIDNDCDGTVDCGDFDCSGIDGCPVCGMVNAPEATPLALPDGLSSGDTCSNDTDCAGKVDPTGNPTPNCIIFQDQTNGNATGKECHASYTSTLNFIGFPANTTLDDPSKLLSVCVTMEHSYLHDLQMELLSPADAGGIRKKVVLHPFVGRVLDEIFLGVPNESDETGPPIPGTGFKYCWTSAAPLEMFDANMNTVASQFGTTKQVPAGDYKPIAPFSGLMGTPLNGQWEMRVTDLFGVDNGFLFGWSIAFDPSLVADCNGPIIQ